MSCREEITLKTFPSAMYTVQNTACNGYGRTVGDIVREPMNPLPFVSYDGLFLDTSLVVSMWEVEGAEKARQKSIFRSPPSKGKHPLGRETGWGPLSALDAAGRGSGSVECVRGFGGRGKERGGRESSTEEEDLVAHCCASDVDICCVAKRTGKEKLS